MREIIFFFSILALIIGVWVYVTRLIINLRTRMSERPITRNAHIEALKERVYGDHKRRPRT